MAMTVSKTEGWQSAEQIAELANKVIVLLRDDPTDPMIKAAALRAAAETYCQAVALQASLLMMSRTINKP